MTEYIVNTLVFLFFLTFFDVFFNMCFEKKYHQLRLFNIHQRTFPVIIVLQKCYYLFQINELEQNYLEKDVHQKQRPRAVTLTLSFGFL